MEFKDFPNFPLHPLTFNNIFSNEVLDLITSHVNFLSPIINKGYENNNIKSNKVMNRLIKKFDFNNIYLWPFFKELYSIIYKSNQYYNFKLTQLSEIYYAEYPGDGTHLEFHHDIGPEEMSFRKISFTINLNNPPEYEGGELEIFYKQNPIVLPQLKGSINLFPSFLLHRIKPITNGTRKVIIGFIKGPSFS